MDRRSLSLRLVAGAALWVIVSLVITGAVLTGLFRDHVERNFDVALNDHVEGLLALAEVDGQGHVVLRRHPSNPRFNKPLSGWYWLFVSGTRTAERSRSLWDAEIAVPEALPGAPTGGVAARGPRGESLRVLARRFTLPDAEAPLTILVAGPGDAIETSIGRFVGILAAALAILGLGLIGAVVVQVRYGLHPLKRMREALADIRAGRAGRMTGAYATEIEPLKDKLNALLEHDATVVERARTQAGNLAHALKTPLAVLTNEADRLHGEPAQVIRHQTSVMADHIDRHLSRARAAGAREVLGAFADVDEVTRGLARTLGRIHEGRALDISLFDTEGLIFQGEQRDLEEILGNLMDNACKWASHQVRVHAEGREGEIFIEIEDNGPGIPEGLLAEALDRGRRLDESTPGSGLGLGIAREIAELYGGSLELGRSSLGGLGARLRLPAG